MHDIKYFFLNKNNQTIQGGQKKFLNGANYRKHYRKALFFEIQGGAPAPAPLGSAPGKNAVQARDFGFKTYSVLFLFFYFSFCWRGRLVGHQSEGVTFII
jgi:hypothetical protein